MIPYLSVTSVCCHQLGLTEVGVTGACKGTVAPGGQWGHQLGLGSVPHRDSTRAAPLTKEEQVAALERMGCMRCVRSKDANRGKVV